jgi:hypothetical protein
MIETPNAEYFIESLYNAGWRGTLDAQHEKIEALWKRITDEHKRELAAMTARAGLAERQVAALCSHIDDYGSCWNCPAKVLGARCSHSSKQCRDALAAWSRAEAEKEGVPV